MSNSHSSKIFVLQMLKSLNGQVAYAILLDFITKIVFLIAKIVFLPKIVASTRRDKFHRVSFFVKLDSACFAKFGMHTTSAF